MTGNTSKSNSQLKKQNIEEAMRAWGDILNIWRLCGKSACRKARACCGDARQCFPQNYPLLPLHVRAWFEALDQAQVEEMTFDQAMEWLGDMGLTDDFHEWCETVEKSAQPAGR